jgi:uncharacterized protein (TIGR03435 family)
MTAILLVLKATALVVVALLLTRLGERRAPAALRALVLTGTLAALLILPIAALVLPPLSVPMTPRLAGLFEATPTTVPDADVSIVVVESGQPLGAGAAAESLRGDRRPAADASTFSVVAVVRLVWLAGVLIVGVRLAIGLWTLRRLRRTAAPWPEGAAVARHLLGEGVAARTAIVLQPNVDAPVTYGLLRPLVALPPDAPQWPASDLRRALIHELEHVRRADWATQVFAQVVCALYWFHPLVWVAARRLRLAMEQACDDAVVRREEVTEYAEQLVVLARRLSGGPAIVSLGMAAGGTLAQRVAAVLDPARARAAIRPAAAVGAFAVALGMAAVIAPLQVRALQDAAEPVFEVAAIRRNLSGSPSSNANSAIITSMPGGRFVMQNTPVYDLIRWAYDVPVGREDLLQDGPDWIRTQRFDINAKAEDDVPREEWNRFKPMVQRLLEERFNLVLLRVPVDGDVYELVRAREDGALGPEIRQADEQTCAGRRAARDANGPLLPSPRRRAPRGAAMSSGECSPIASLLPTIERQMQRAVVDRTDLDGLWDYSIIYTGSRPSIPGLVLPVEPFAANQDYPVFETALQEQLGLRLQRRRGTTNVLRIESIDPPTGN